MVEITIIRGETEAKFIGVLFSHAEPGVSRKRRYCCLFAVLTLDRKAAAAASHNTNWPWVAMKLGIGESIVNGKGS